MSERSDEKEIAANEEWIDGILYRHCYGPYKVAVKAKRDLRHARIEDHTTVIEYSAFNGCTELVSVEIPDSIVRVGEWAFGGCKSLASVAIPDGVTKIKGSAFYNCPSLLSESIPAALPRLARALLKAALA